MSRQLTRRRIAQMGGAIAVGALAGCLGDETDPNGNGAADDDMVEAPGATDDTGDADDEDGDPAAEQRLDEPVEFPPEHACPVCNMIPAEHPEWNTQLVHSDGTREFFDTTGCLAAYVTHTDRFGGPDSPVENAWVTGVETGELIDASEAVFVRVTDSDHVDDIMRMNPTPFADRADAEAFIEQFDEYDGDDLITFEDFDGELAMLYRERFLEDGDMDDHDGMDDH